MIDIISIRKMQADHSASQINTFISKYILGELGFQIASQTIIPSLLKKITPAKGNAFRDAFEEGCKILIKLSNAIKETGSQQQWNFLYITVVDHQDTHSKTSLPEVIKTMCVIHQLVRVKSLKIVIVGIDLPEKAQDEINSIVKAAGLNALYIRSEESDIQSPFEQIYSILDSEARQESFYTQNSERPRQEEVRRQNFAVLLSLAADESMRGPKWLNLCNIIDRLSDKLTRNDIFGTLVFNDQVKSVSKMNPSDEFFKAPKPSIRSSIYQDKKELALKQSIEETIYQPKGCQACQII